MKKKILLILGCSLMVSGLIATSYVLNQTKEVDNKEQFDLNVESNNNFRITNIKRSNTSDGYGQTEFTYSVSPNNATANILYKLEYSNGSSVADDVLNISHYPGSSRFVVKCVKPFINQIHMTLYPQNQEDLTAVVKFDFKEKLTVTSSLVQNEGSLLAVDTIVNSTGGSVTVDKTVKNETYSWNKGFVSDIKNYLSQLDHTFANEPFWHNGINSDLETGVNVVVGLEDSDLQKWFTNTNFTNDAFDQSIYYEIEYWYVATDDISTGTTTIPEGTETEHYYEKYYITDIDDITFREYFSGDVAVIDYTCEVDGVKYSDSFGLTLSQISVTSLNTSIGDYTF